MTSRLSTITRISFAVWLLCLPAIAAADGPAWGPASTGLRIAVETKPGDHQLHVLFRNERAGYIGFAVGGRTGVGDLYTIDFAATAPDGSTCKVVNTTVGAVGGYVGPITIRLAPGAADQVSIELWHLRCTKGSYPSLDQLLKKGYSVRATLNVSVESNDWAGVVNGWTGAATSGSFTMKNSGGL